jgi:hypothetical protein
MGCQGHPAPLTERDLEVSGIPASADTGAARRIAGAPAATSMATEPDEEGVHVTTWTYPNFELSFDGRGHRYQVVVRTPGVTTIRGLRVGDDTGRISRLYGPPRMADSSYRLYGIDPQSDTNTSGVLIDIAAGRVRRIVVGYVIGIN